MGAKRTRSVVCGWEKKLSLQFLLEWSLPSELGADRSEIKSLKQTNLENKSHCSLVTGGEWRGETLSVSQTSFFPVLVLTLGLSSGSCFFCEIPISIEDNGDPPGFLKNELQAWDKQSWLWGGTITTSCLLECLLPPSLPPSHRCLKPVFDLDKVQPVFKECKKSCLLFGLGPNRLTPFPSEVPVPCAILFPHLIVKRCITPGSEMALMLFAAAAVDQPLQACPPFPPRTLDKGRVSLCTSLTFPYSEEKSLPLLPPLSSKVMHRHSADFPLCRFPTSPVLYPLYREDRWFDQESYFPAM